MVRLVHAARAEERLALARRWLAARRRDEELLVVAASETAASELVRAVAAEGGAVFGWRRQTLSRLASELAQPELSDRGLAPASQLVIEGLVARMVHGRGAALGRLAAVADQPGLPRALAATLLELRLEAVVPEALASLGGLLAALGEELERAQLADRARVLELAAAAPARFSGWPILFVDVPIGCTRERELVRALAARAADVLALVPSGDVRSLAHFREALATEAEELAVADDNALGRLQARLFSAASAQGEAALDDGVRVLSAPGESRECVEIARLVRREAARGVAFDRMAILLRAPEAYRPHLEEALRRAGVPAHFASGSVEPDPSGRAFLALLACAAEGLSARRFAEYMSLGELADAGDEGAPPPPRPPSERWVVPDDELVSAALARGTEEQAPREEPLSFDDPRAAPVRSGSLRAPRRWERLLVEAAVIGGRERWERRLAGLERELQQQELEDPDGPAAAMRARDLDDLRALRRYALPLLEAVDALPANAFWAEWIDELGALATRALRRPERVLAVLAELRPMAEIGPVDLRQVRLTLERRLSQLTRRPSERRYGRIFVAPCEAARGMAFDVVFVPGLAERVFPQKVIEDPILRDDDRLAAGGALAVNDDRVAAERLALRIAAGAARDRLVLSYPRLDVDQARPRVPSFYGLEVLRAAAGTLPGFDELIEAAERGGAARIGWPAPESAADAIDEAEHDLALLDELSKRPEEETVGTARYLLGANEHLARALRFRARRWRSKWTAADGLVDPSDAARAVLAAQRLGSEGARSFSPTALQSFASCPYRFLLYTVYKLAPRKMPQAIEDLDPLSRGSLVHDVQFELLAELRDAGMLPLASEAVEEAQARLETVLERVAARYHDDLAPAIERVWLDAVSSIRADLREWLRRSAGESWTPWRFELAFGLRDRRGRDPASRLEPVALDQGLLLRGAIDLVEKKGESLRATDHKTGKVRADEGAVVGGGETLQPVLYALALEKMFPDLKVEEGRLYYCTASGGFTERRFPLDEHARRAAGAVIAIIAAAVSCGFLPAAPKEGACRFCDYQSVCGPWEEVRIGRKSQKRIDDLVRLRRMT